MITIRHKFNEDGSGGGKIAQLPSPDGVDFRDYLSELVDTYGIDGTKIRVKLNGKEIQTYEAPDTMTSDMTVLIIARG